VWTFDPRSAVWTLKEPDTSPPGVCCAQEDVFDPVRGRFLRFPSFSGSHGWQWWREIYLNDSSVWAYDLASNTWRDLRPLPAARPRPLRCASWDAEHEVVLLFGGEGSNEGTWVYDPHRNSWTRKKPPREPEPRSGGNMAYDAARRAHILFGAQFSNDPRTWAYDLARNEWRDLAPEGHPHSDRNDAVLAYDPDARLVVAIVKITVGEEEAARHRLETWSFDGGANRWRKMDPPAEPDPSGNRARVLVHAPGIGLLLENRTHPPHGPAEQQIWAYRPGPPGDPTTSAGRPPARSTPPIVEEAVVSVVSTREVEIAWKPPRGGEAAGYLLERAAVEVLSEDQLRRLESRTPPLGEPSVGAIRRIGPFRRLVDAPRKEISFTDRSVDLERPAPVEGEAVFTFEVHDEHLDAGGKPYRFAVHAYRVVAVNAAGEESGPSPAFFTIPSAPRWVFSRESGTACDLRWRANPERSIRGYRVYRMDGRYDDAPIPRLTAEPIGATEYTDPGAGKATRRYHVVAVDALGQEGFPSAPVWFQREWKKFYEPFTGEWHQ
jgi:hypothetical protein